MLRSASANTDCASGSTSTGTVTPSGQSMTSGPTGDSTLHPARHLGGQRRRRRLHNRRQRSLERRAQVRQRLLHLHATALALIGVQRALGAQRQRHPEQSLHDPLVDLAGQLEALAQSPRALLLAGGVAGGGDQRRRLAQRPQQMALAVGQLEAAAAAVGADHAVGVAGRAQRRAHERRDPEQLGVLGRHLVLDSVGDDHHLVLEQCPLGDRGRQQRRRRLQVHQLAKRGAVRPDHVDAAARRRRP